MNAKKVFYAMIAGIVGVCILGVVTIVMGNSVLSKHSAHLEKLRLDSQVLNAQQSSLSEAKKEVQKNTDLNNIARTIVPQEKDQALTVREITDIANQNKISITSITFPASNLGLGTSTAPGSSSTPTAPVVHTPSQLLPVHGLSGFYIMPITIQSSTNDPITYGQFIA
ncbi:MAG: hypothetical protein ACHQT9_04280, partial [Candidatus Saccharimonadales bacterium]